MEGQLICIGEICHLLYQSILYAHSRLEERIEILEREVDLKNKILTLEDVKNS